MLATQVNACKHDKLRMTLGFDWSWGLGFCEALLGWVLLLVAAAVPAPWPCVLAFLDRRSTPSLCVLAGAVGPHCIVFGSVVGWELAALHSCLVLL
jgi:hypothetical protein